jgi:hypothetical protein
LRQRSQELAAVIPVVISNHQDLEQVAHDFGINYHYIPINAENKLEQEQQQLSLLKQYKIDLVLSSKIYAGFKSRFFIPVFAGHKYSPFIFASLCGCQSLPSSLQEGCKNYWSHCPLCN